MNPRLRLVYEFTQLWVAVAKALVGIGVGCHENMALDLRISTHSLTLLKFNNFFAIVFRMYYVSGNTINEI